ncbi:MAG: XdhC family protein, partial [Alcaligenes sp.]
LFNGFDVTVCDPRSEHIEGWSVAGARVVRGMPDDEVIACVPDRRTAVVALTHDPKLDDLALLEALKSSAFYVGAIGSRRNNQSRRERLAEYFDLTAEEIDRLKGPIGLYVGSKTPAEIAVSIMAEIIAVKNGVDVPRELSVASVKNRQEQQSA